MKILQIFNLENGLQMLIVEQCNTSKQANSLASKYRLDYGLEFLPTLFAGQHGVGVIMVKSDDPQLSLDEKLAVVSVGSALEDY